MRRPSQEEEAIVRGSLEAVQRGLYRKFLSGKDLAIVERGASRPKRGLGSAVDGAADAGSGALVAGQSAKPGPSDPAPGAVPVASDAGKEPGPQVADDAHATTSHAAERAAPGAATGATQLEVVLADAAIWRLPPALLEDAPGGLRVGVLDPDAGFAFDLQGALVYARETRNQTIRVNEKATRLFLYGRDILGDSVLGFDKRLGMGDHCIVVNPRHEAIGIGEVVGRFKGAGPAVRAVHDLGSYLRDQ